MMITVFLAAATLLSFEGTTKAAMTVEKAENLSFVDGVKGQAVYLPKDGALVYRLGAETLKRDEGSVRFWFKYDRTVKGNFSRLDRCLNPAGDWDPAGGNPDYRMLFNCVGSVLFCGGPFVHATFCSYGRCYGWNGEVHGGEWHQLGMTWKKDVGYHVYFDGQHWGTMKWPEKFIDKFKPAALLYLGCGKNWCGQETGAIEGCIDEVLLSTQALTEKDFADDYASVYGERVELLDWSVEVGTPKALRFRARDAKTGALREWTETVVAEKPGLFTYERNKGKKDYRAYELMAFPSPSVCERACAVGGGTPTLPFGDRPSPTLRHYQNSALELGTRTLLAEFDCTKEYPSEVFHDCGSHVVTNGTLVYREANVAKSHFGFGYHVTCIRNPHKAHWIEVDYPDDAKREYSASVLSEGSKHIYNASTDAFGVMTGVDTPLSGKMQTGRMLFWPDNASFTFLMLNFRSLRNSRPVAAARVRVYEADDVDDRAADKVLPDADAPRRTVGMWDEDPTMDSILSFAHANNFRYGDLDFWKTKWEHSIAYAKYHGINAWTIKTMSYWGDVTSMKATLGHANCFQGEEGRCHGWDALGAHMLDRAGMDIWARYNHRVGMGPFFERLAGVDDVAELFMTDSKGSLRRHEASEMKPYHPGVIRAFQFIIRAYRDRYKVYRHFKGVTMNETSGLHFGSEKNGYDDDTVGRFERETGVRVPVKDAPGRYAFLTSPANRKAWFDWRCRTVTLAAGELAAALRDEGGDLTLQYWVRADLAIPNMMLWPDGWDLEDNLRGAGIDLKALNAIPGLRVVQCIRPNFNRPYACELQSNEDYLNYSPEESRLYRAAGITAMNVFEHANFEVYPGLDPAPWVWKNKFAYDPGYDSTVSCQFTTFATPHPPTDFAVEDIAHLIAEYDLKDLMHGWWGGTESGANSEYAKIFKAFVSLPREDFDLLPGRSDDPVAVRVARSGKGWYAVNRLPWKVWLGAIELGPCEVRYFAGENVPCSKSLTVRLSEEASDYFRTQVRNFESILKVNPANSLWRYVLDQVKAAVASGRYGRARALLRTAAARASREANPFSRKLQWDYAKKSLSVSLGNYGNESITGELKVSSRWADGKSARFVPEDAAPRKFALPPGEERTFVFPFRKTGDVDIPTARDVWGVTVVTPAGKEGAEYVFRPLFAAPEGAKPKLGENRVEVASKKPDFKMSGWYEVSYRPDLSGLVIEAECDDKDVVEPTEVTQMFRADSIQIYFDQCNNTRMAKPKGYDADDLVYQIGRMNGRTVVYGEQPLGVSGEGITADIRHDAKRRRTHYSLFVPRERLPLVDFKPGSSFRFALLFNNTEADGSHGGASFDNPYNHPGSWHVLYLE